MDSLWDVVARQPAGFTAEIHGPTTSVAASALLRGSTLGGALESLRGRSILIATREQLSTAAALLELDGVARRMVLCTPDLSPDSLAHVAEEAEADAIVVDSAAPTALAMRHVAMVPPQPAASLRRGEFATEWVLLTSGTTGSPKLVVHTLDSLSGALPRRAAADNRCVWSTFYDIRRYGGLQIYLRAIVGGSSLVLSSPAESSGVFLTRAAHAGVTHISGTPSHWRRVLMDGDAALAPEYVRMSGEIADQPLIDALRKAYPRASVAHAFASTEAGVAFDVQDGLAGFPAQFLGETGAIHLRAHEGTLRVRSPRTAAKYLGHDADRLVDDEGYVDTGDLVERIADRYYFRGRRGGIINVGGFKVYPEEVESVLNSDARVRMSLVKARRSPITGAVVVAEIVLNDSALLTDMGAVAHLKSQLLEHCRLALPAYKVPARLQFVPQLEMNAAGKLVRPGA